MKKQKGITLVSLVVTIIVLIILAGVSINLLLGEKGIITTAKRARENTELAKIQEETELNELYAQLENNGGSSEETNYDAISKLIEFKEKIAQAITSAGIQTSKEDSAETMSNNIEQLPNLNQSVYYVTLSDGYKLPVPKNFYYVGGDLNTGVIISDKEADKYDGKTDKTTYEYTTSLVGNQFVWIPCESNEYKKCDTWNGISQTSSSLATAEWDTMTQKAELSQIEKYDGFYVGRYEAGLASTITEFTTNQKHTGSNQVYNLDGVPQSKAGIVPWNFIDWTHSKANAESMYNNNYVSSGLITGTQWDVILNTMLSKKVISASELTNSSICGNYSDNSISYNGRLAKADYNSTNLSAWTLKPFGTKGVGKTTKYSSNNGELLTTGASDTTEKYHIFDLGGNVWEWTEEDSHYATSRQYRVLRGGGCVHPYGTCPVCYRVGHNTMSYTGFDVGFRVVLYIK